MAILLTLTIRCKCFRDCKRRLFKVIHLHGHYRQYVCCIGLIYIPEHISDITLCFWCQYAFSLYVRSPSEKRKKEVSALSNQTLICLDMLKTIFPLKRYRFPSSSRTVLQVLGWKEEKTSKATVLYSCISQFKAESSKSSMIYINYRYML